MQNAPAPSAETNALAGERLLLVTKFAAPQASADLVARPRLTSQLLRAAHCPLTLIAAPAGFGKTTVLSAWLNHTPCAVAWVSLEHGDDDLPRFWSYVFAAVEQIQPGSGASALALLRGSDPHQPTPIETVLTVWINGLAALPDEVALVLDDYHLITAQPIHRAVTYLLDHMPQRLRLVIATRADPPLPLARLRARGQLTELRAADLRFTTEETATFLKMTLGLDLAGEDIAALAARTEGWIAGLRLAALSMQGRSDIPDFLRAFTGSQRYIIDYLTEEVLARQPEPVQTFLLQTAILERLTGSLCEAVLGVSGGEAGGVTSGQTMLEQLEQANLFLVPLDGERRWYRYHQLFAEALRHRLQRTHPALAPELHRRASAWYERHGLTHDAVYHALAAADFAQAAHLIGQAFNMLVRRGEIATLQRWVAALPDELARSDIELAILQGWLLFVGGEHAAAEQHLQEIERTFDSYPASPIASETPVSDELAGRQAISGGAERLAEIRGRIAAIRASIAITQGDLPRAITLSRLALADLPKDHMARTYTSWYLGRAYWLSGDVKAASTALAEAAHISWDVNHLYSVFVVTHDLAHVQQAQGQLHQADQTYRQALERARERAGDVPAMGPASVGRGRLAYEWNHLDAATSLLHEGIAHCELTGNGRAILQAHITLAFIKRAQGDGNGANARMRQAAQISERQDLVRYRYVQEETLAFQAWLSLMQGDEASYGRWLLRCDLNLDKQLNHVREREYLTLVRILIAQRRLDEAAQWLARLLSLAEAQGRTGSVIELLMLQAEVWQASGAAHQAIACISQALALAEPEGYTRLFVDEGAPMAQLLTQVLTQLRAHRRGNQPGATRYREHLLALLGASPDAGMAQHDVAGSGAGMSSLVEPLSERELAVLRLIVAGDSNQEIADHLILALSTVKWYINAIYGKLQVESRTKAIARARDLHIV